jgi:hypothetical protein
MRLIPHFPIATTLAHAPRYPMSRSNPFPPLRPRPRRAAHDIACLTAIQPPAATKTAESGTATLRGVAHAEPVNLLDDDPEPDEPEFVDFANYNEVIAAGLKRTPRDIEEPRLMMLSDNPARYFHERKSGRLRRVPAGFRWLRQRGNHRRHGGIVCRTSHNIAIKVSR